MKIISYQRVSTDEQAESGLGITAQRMAGARFQHREYPEYAIPQNFKDEGKKGSLPPEKRPGLLEALEALEEGDILFVAKRDRLARDFVVAAMLEGLVKAKGARVVSLDAPDEDTPSAWLQKAILDVFSHYERLVIAFRTRAALAVKKKNGERVGSVPYGKDLSKDGTTLVDNLDEQRWIEWMKIRRGYGWSFRRIADCLTEDRIPTKTVKKRWTHTTVARILGRAET